MVQEGCVLRDEPLQRYEDIMGILSQLKLFTQSVVFVLNLSTVYFDK